MSLMRTGKRPSAVTMHAFGPASKTSCRIHLRNQYGFYDTLTRPR